MVEMALVEYDFIIRSILSNPDGYPRSVVIMHHANSSWDVDQTLPGPLIRAKFADRLRIHITNMLHDQSTAIHFHDLYMINNPWADEEHFGIIPHNVQQYADGLIGPIILDHGGIEQRYNYGSNDYVIMLQE
ncbi:unnamed protein product [Rotaria sordida]|uniref:Plastocyanin-like domain-containing protein n=2 Tax=Rotaria sordida TaxID=392033 RepID=A0A814CN64_9BILA|nr:unnamed protein product [Rotaria sordida]CAF3747924.1 unnamed protein product [Rotaria sordida]CAF3874152.1 unnamed protein product [Rotaria sordida]